MVHVHHCPQRKQQSIHNNLPAENFHRKCEAVLSSRCIPESFKRKIMNSLALKNNKRNEVNAFFRPWRGCLHQLRAGYRKLSIRTGKF